MSTCVNIKHRKKRTYSTKGSTSKCQHTHAQSRAHSHTHADAAHTRIRSVHTRISSFRGRNSGENTKRVSCRGCVAVQQRNKTIKQKKLICGFSICLARLYCCISTQSDPVAACHSRLRTPRARAMEPGLDPHLPRPVQAVPLRAPQARARGKTRDRKRKVWYSGKKKREHLINCNISSHGRTGGENDVKICRAW